MRLAWTRGSIRSMCLETTRLSRQYQTGAGTTRFANALGPLMRRLELERDIKSGRLEDGSPEYEAARSNVDHLTRRANYMLSPEERRTREAVGLMGKDATKQRLSTLPLASEPYSTPDTGALYQELRGPADMDFVRRLIDSEGPGSRVDSLRAQELLVKDRNSRR